MADLLTLAQIEADSVGDPGEVGAQQLRMKIRALLYRRAYAAIEAFAANPPSGQDQLEMLALAQRVLRHPEQFLDSALRMALVEAPPAATREQITSASDAAIEAVLTPARLALLAKGLRLGG